MLMFALPSACLRRVQGALLLALAPTLCSAASAPGELLAAQEGHLTASDGTAGDMLGFDVAVWGDTAIAGAYGEASNKGSAYVFVRNGAEWTQQQELAASDGVAGDLFGCSVAIAGDTAVVGARYDDLGLSSDAGSAYVFVRNGAAWTQQQQLVAPGGTSADEFGSAVAISGDTVVVGAPMSAQGGSAYVFVRSGTAWTFQKKLVAADASAGAFLGNAVAVLGDTAIAGAPGDATAGPETGAAYVFQRTGTAWGQEAKLTASDGTASDALGLEVALSGDTAIAGAPFAGGAGAAYVFTRQGSTWTEEERLAASDGQPFDDFGAAVAVAGDVALVGALFDAHAGGFQAGSAYLFARSGSTWTEELKLTASDAAAQDWFGASCALDGDTAVIAASSDIVAGALDAGSACAFRLLECSLSLPASEVVRVGTPPNPPALKPGQTSGPVLGKVWDPFIDHTTFMPAAALDLLGIATAPASIPTGLGTLLVGTPPFLIAASPAPGAPFELELPFACIDAGLAFTAQGASLEAGGKIALTNALDIVVGTF
jgi:hypothetical protein